MRRPYVTAIFIEELENGNVGVILRIPTIEIVLAEFKNGSKALRCKTEILEAMGKGMRGEQRFAFFTPLSVLHEQQAAAQLVEEIEEIA